MILRRTALALAGLGLAVSVGCSSDPAVVKTVAAPEAPGRVSTPFTVVTDAPTTTIAPTTTTVAPTTTTRPRTTTTIKRAVTAATATPAPTVATVAPWCSATAVPASTTKGQLVTVLITSNLPRQATNVRGQTVTTDPGGSAAVSFSSPGGQLTATMGRILPRTNTVEVTFYDGPHPTTDQFLDGGPIPPVLATCSTKFISVGP